MMTRKKCVVVMAIMLSNGLLMAQDNGTKPLALKPQHPVTGTPSTARVPANQPAQSPASGTGNTSDPITALKIFCGYDAALAESDSVQQRTKLAQAQGCINTMLARAKTQALVKKQAEAEAAKQSKAIKQGTEKTLSQSLPDDAGHILLDEINAAQPKQQEKTPSEGSLNKQTEQSHILADSTGGNRGALTPSTPNAATSATPPTPNVGTIAQQSVWATPNACSTTGVQGSSAVLHVHRSLVRPQEVADNFAKRSTWRERQRGNERGLKELMGSHLCAAKALC